MTPIADHIKDHPITRIVTHANCPDGIASAMILKDLWPDAEVVFCQYQTDEHQNLKPQPGTIFADFSPHDDNLQDHIASGAICLDHHFHAKDKVEAFGHLGVYGENDDLECGAMLCNQLATIMQGFDGPRDHFAYLAAVRDTWRKGDTSAWLAACEQAMVLMFYPAEHWLSGDHRPYLTEFEKDLGGMLLAKHMREVRKAAETAYIDNINGKQWAYVNCGGALTSDVAEHLRKAAGANVIVCYSVDGLGTQYSLRSDGSVDVGAIAKKFGGGGHQQAAGYSRKHNQVGPHPIAEFALDMACIVD